jgi:uncharacterized protein (TIGR03000 family)
MKLTTIRSTSLAICTAVMCLASSTASAGWGSVGGSSGGYSYGSSGGSTGAVAYYGSTGRAPFTPIRSVLRGIGNHIAAKHERHQMRRAARYSYGSSGYSTSYGSSGGGYSASYGSSGYSTSYGSSGYSTSYGSSGYSTSYGSTGSVSYGSTGAVSYGSTGSYGASYGSDGSVYHGASNTISDSGMILASNVTADEAVYLTVNVPSTAKVFVNNKPTTSSGSVRQFISRGLQHGKTYKFDVRAEITTADGEVIQEEKSVVVVPGADEHLQFAFEQSSAKIQTALKLNVPEGAKVTLAGNPTKATGTERVYQSSHLKLGESWDDYVVEVELDGKVKRQSIRLIGGDELALTFNFDDQPGQLAAK